jgi:ATP-dependent helicase/nuclease subunit A
MLVAEGKLSETAAESVNPYDIYLFCQSSLCKRMLKAKDSGKLFQEQPFVIARPANEISEAYTGNKDVLIQGIIDAYFEEDDEIIVLDYKTDHVKSSEELIGRYKKQLELYAEALEQTTGKKVKERIIYSFCLGKEIPVLSWFALVLCPILLYHKNSVEDILRKQIRGDVLWNLYYRPMKEK